MIHSLPPGAPGQETQTWIRKTRGVCGGDACIRNTRIPVWALVVWRRLGVPDEEICDQLPGLTPSDLALAWAYADDHPQEIADALRENEEA
jgi:uncharacterized protein (DUF433 family)